MSFNLAYRYIDDILSINNHDFHNYVHLIYPDELEVKDTTEYDLSASYLDILRNIDPNGRLITTVTLYDKRDDFHFPIFNCHVDYELCGGIHARRWKKSEGGELQTLSGWITTIRR
jgi:hypothetical protein